MVEVKQTNSMVGLQMSTELVSSKKFITAFTQRDFVGNPRVIKQAAEKTLTACFQN